MNYDKIKGLVFDIDGVFTDGGILADLKGELYRTYDAKDGFGVRMAVMKGYKVGVITGGRSQSIKERLYTCGIKDEDIYLGSRNKMEDMNIFLKKHGLQMDNILYVGDDVPDMEVIKSVGIGACPEDSVREIIECSDIVIPRPGGKGCVRWIIEQILKAHGKWEFDVDIYKKKF